MGRLFALALVAGCADPPTGVPIVLDKEQYVVGEPVTFYVDDFCITDLKTSDCWGRWFVSGVDGIVVQQQGADPIASIPGEGTLEVTAHWAATWNSADVTDSVMVPVVQAAHE